NPFTMSKTKPEGLYRGEPRIWFLHSWKVFAATPPANRQWWWSQSGSNRRPQACKASALPTELWPRTGEGGVCLLCLFRQLVWWAEKELNLRPHAYQACAL